MLTQGDSGSVSGIHTTHTFQILDSDTWMIGVIVPGGFEDLFYALETDYTSDTDTPYFPAHSNSSSSLGFEPRRDIVNDTALVDNSEWHTGDNVLDNADEP